MIKFIDINESEPYKKFESFYKKAEFKENFIEAVCISSFDHKLNQVESRFVNLKYIKNDEWIFFSNYNSPKAHQFKSHNQISAVFFWPSINCQVRIKAKIRQTSKKFSNEHYASRSQKKNALSNISNQSKKIDTYEIFMEKYLNDSKDKVYENRPEYWGGFSFTPYYFEFWEGHNSRVNKRCVYELKNKKWVSCYLQP